MAAGASVEVELLAAGTGPFGNDARIGALGVAIDPGFNRKGGVTGSGEIYGDVSDIAVDAGTETRCGVRIQRIVTGAPEHDIQVSAVITADIVEGHIPVGLIQTPVGKGVICQHRGSIRRGGSGTDGQRNDAAGGPAIGIADNDIIVAGVT